MLQNFSVAISVSPPVCFVLVLILISVFLGWCNYELGIFHASRATRCLGAGAELEARVGRPRAGLGPQCFLLLAVPGRLFCFGSLVILDVARCYLWLFTLYINIKNR